MARAAAASPPTELPARSTSSARNSAVSGAVARSANGSLGALPLRTSCPARASTAASQPACGDWPRSSAGVTASTSEIVTSISSKGEGCGTKP
eukprot:jgi/Chrpa1/16163/Chrysochromulina_OHIO_Genome00003603-RA